MFSKTCARLPSLSVACAFLAGILGCGGVDPIKEKDLEIEELSYLSARQRESLESALQEVEKLSAENGALRRERTALVNENQSLGASLRSVNEAAERTAGQAADLNAKITELRETNERLSQNLDKVKSVASASVGELADLRLKRQELEDRVQTLSQAQSTLSEEATRQGREIAKLKDELTRARAVVRSLQEGGEVADGTSPSDQIEHLANENADLRGEIAALKKRIEILAAPPPGVSKPGTPEVASAVAGTLYRQNPEGLLQEFGGLLKHRYERALKGQIAWDGFDYAFVGTVCLMMLVVAWLVVRWFRLRRLVRKVKVLKARVAELEQGVDAGPRGRGQVGRPGQNVRRVRSAAVRRSGFSAVISRQEVPATQEPVDEAPQPQPSAAPQAEAEDVLEKMAQGVDEFLEERETVIAGAPSSGPALPSAEPRRVIGARSWAAPSEPEDGGDLANTEIIQRVSESDMPPVSLPSVEPGLPAAPSSEASSPALAPKPAEEAPPQKPPSESDLLAELKAVINKKFDELLK